MAQAKSQAEDARASRSRNTPPSSPEPSNSTPEPPKDSTTATPENTTKTIDIVKFKETIARNPLELGVKANFKRAISQLSGPERDVLVGEYILSLKNVSQDIRNTPADRKSALSALENSILTWAIPLAEKRELAKFIQIQREADEAMEQTIQRRRIEAAQLATKINTLFQWINVDPKAPEADKLKAQRDALITLLEDDTISTGQKEVIWEFFPEGSDEAVTQNTITGCVHKMIYVSQDVWGDIWEQITNAHSRLLADTAAIKQINTQLEAAHIANIEATVNDNVNIKR